MAPNIRTIAPPIVFDPRAGPKHGDQSPTRKAPDSNRNRWRRGHPPSCGLTFRARFYPRYSDQIEELIAKEAQGTGRSELAAISSSAARSGGLALSLSSL